MKSRTVLSVAAAALLGVTAFAQLAADAGDLRTRAERGDTKAQLALGRSLVGTDPVEAFAWLSLAVERGEASTEHTRLFGELTPAQYAAAERKTAELRSRLGDTAAPVVPAATAAAAEIAALKEQVQKLTADLAATRGLADGATIARTKLAAVEKELVSTKGELAARDVRAGEAAAQLRRDLDAAMQQRDQIAEQLSQFRREKASAELDRETLRAELAALRAQPAPAAAPATESAPPAAPAAPSADLERELHEAKLKVDMTVRAFALKDEEAQRAVAKAEQAVAAQAEAERARDAALVAQQQAQAEAAAAKQAEAAALAAKAQMQNDLYAAQVRIENFQRAYARGSAVPAAAMTALPAPTDLGSAGATAVPATPAGSAAARPSAATPTNPATVPAETAATAPVQPAGPRTHKVAEGETLSLLAFRYYGSPNKWDRIYAANRSKLKNPDFVAPGTVLTIP